MTNDPRIYAGYFRGRQLMQKRGSVGGQRNVFVKLQGIKNELVYPTFGGVVMNPFKGVAKAFAGDLCWFKTDDKGGDPEVYILKTYEVVSASGTTININKGGGYRHIPFVGDILMLAPDVLGGTGTGVTVSAVTETEVTVSNVSYPVWALTVSANIASSLEFGSVLVEAVEAGASKKMLVETVNTVLDCDLDFIGIPKIASGKNTIDQTTPDYDASRFMYTPALGGLMYIHKMSPMPQCVLDINPCNINGWYKIGYLNKNDVAAASLDARVTTLEQ